MPVISMRIPDELGALIGAQRGVVARRQAVEYGMSRAAWEHTGPPTLLQRIIAALLYTGPGAMLTGTAALQRHRVAGRYGFEHIDVLIPHSRRRSSVAYVRILRTRRMPALSDDDLPCASVVRAVGDACRRLTDLDDVRAIVAGAVQQRKCTTEQLVREVADGPMKGSALLREAVGEALAGVRSAAEGQGRSVLRGAGVPEAQWNVDLYSDTGEWLGRPDGWWAEAGVALEIDSREWHLDPAGWERTMERHAQMTKRGILVVHVTPKLIWRRPAEFVARVANALEAGRHRGPVPVRSGAGTPSRQG
jgi:hypothetical protein